MLDTQADEIIEHNLGAAILRNHLQFLRSLPDTVRFGDYLLVHAGLRPGVAFEDQTANDLRWIRKPFLTSKADHGFMVVHGHSVTWEVEARANRIGIDTGAYTSGVPTALAIEDDHRCFLQASEDELGSRDSPKNQSPLRPGM
jgi:serine/threonine protein phosphatase 1